MERCCELYDVRPESLRPLLARMRECRFAKGDTVIRTGARHTAFYLLESGIWREYFFDNDGEETTHWFFTPGEAVFSTWSYARNAPSRVSVEAVCDSVALCIEQRELEELYASSIELAGLGRKIIENHLLGIENWLLDGGERKAADRYRTLLNDTPEVLRHTSLKHIASYLRITPQSLSRIRASIHK
ncbi:Crp/Fnr family transcriptional regulator [uncultured Alistipes sp.]|uniref:Crp/Fnr family transcriptional regulator n=1 Tax=uncultured Alistipes sp. TaxID=538949 RepID=UPI0026075B8A|nr:Crp/Fnr family transcriptional regulator [uncultured Alistipes sp.]